MGNPYGNGVTRVHRTDKKSCWSRVCRRPHYWHPTCACGWDEYLMNGPERRGEADAWLLLLRHTEEDHMPWLDL